jgi:hypothetical protein
MKTNLLGIFTVAALAASAALAQSSTPAKANVPFNFIAGTRTLPAGEYTVMTQGPAADTVIIRSADGKGAVIVLAQPLSSVDARHGGKLVFHRYGDTYFLSEIWGPGNDGREIPTTRRERELATKLATPDNTTVATLH